MHRIKVRYLNKKWRWLIEDENAHLVLGPSRYGHSVLSFCLAEIGAVKKSFWKTEVEVIVVPKGE